ncbi:MAG TPA: PAS domain S-box protein [Spirochaetes bacterium]|nr:PAS domain S-box protein [Spirochaetota bacterium]
MEHMQLYRFDHDNEGWITQYQKLLDSLNIGFALVDMDENFLEVNQTLLRMTGAKREDIIGKNNRDFYAEEDLNLMVLIGKSLQQYGKYQYEFFIPTASGEKTPVLFNSSINYDDEGNPETISIMITDIREQKKIQKALLDANRELTESRDTLEREKKKLETILFGIGDSVSIFDPVGDLLMRNPLGDLIHGSNREPIVTLEAGARRELALEVDGEERHFSGHVEEIRDREGVSFAYVEILKDITDNIRFREQSHELLRVKRELKRYSLSADMISASAAMLRVRDLALRCSEVDSTVLVLGETGVGKEVAARSIHANSARREKPFVAINCGALPETLLESELFGHTRGAFTGANTERDGLFREANGGTLFLDEIGDISEALQVKLLRALQEREVRPLGSAKTYPVDVRVIAATNRDLPQLMREGRFRKDLYYRIAVIPLHIPPLRERKDDIPPLARYFLRKHNSAARFDNVVLHRSAQQKLLDYDWPGNIRELENAIEHALAMAAGPVIYPAELPVQICGDDECPEGPAASIRPAVKDERALIIEALNHHKGNRQEAARDLGISRTSLWRKMKLHGI